MNGPRTATKVRVDTISPAKGSRGPAIHVSAAGRGVTPSSGNLLLQTATTGHKVLVVPVTAIYTGADGSTDVRKIGGDVIREVPVRVGLSAGGYVHVTAVSAATPIWAGDRVTIQDAGAPN